MRIFFRRIHLYLGLLAGLVLTVTYGTGSILVFEKELHHLIHHDRYFVNAYGARFSVEALMEKVRVVKPGIKVTGVKMYADPERTPSLWFRAGTRKTRGRKTAQKRV